MTSGRIAAALAFALFVAACGGDTAAEPATTSTVAATGEPSTSTTTTTLPPFEFDDNGRSIAELTGSSLPQLPESGTDPAIGMPAPIVEGLGVDGRMMSIGPTGGPQAIVFLAHWCSHCRNEVTEFTEWLQTESLPEGASITAVTTAIDKLRQNYPPEDWLEDEMWPVPTLVDPTNQVADAFGLTAFPFWVLVDGDGVVVVRGAGGIAPEGVAQALATIGADDVSS